MAVRATCNPTEIRDTHRTPLSRVTHNPTEHTFPISTGVISKEENTQCLNCFYRSALRMSELPGNLCRVRLGVKKGTPHQGTSHSGSRFTVTARCPSTAMLERHLSGIPAPAYRNQISCYPGASAKPALKLTHDTKRKHLCFAKFL